MKNFIDVQLMEVITDNKEVMIVKIYHDGVWQEISHKDFWGK
jgi:hypothetical protein